MTAETTFTTFVSSCFPVVFTITLLAMYSFLINSIHGHPTFWKWKWRRWVLFPNSGCGSSSKRIRLKSIVRKPSKDRVMETIEEYILHEALSFLTADEMLIISSLSRRFRAMTQQKKVWHDLATIYFQTIPSLSHENALLSLVNKRAFFTYLKQYPLILAKSRTNRFVIGGKVYELPVQFMSEHPGGEAILIEHAGSDASREFSLANHSALAITLAESFVIWPAIGLFNHPMKRRKIW